MNINEKDIKILGTIFITLLTVFVGLYHAFKTPIMGDEALTLFLGTLKSLHSLFEGLKLGADSHGPFYHFLNFLYQKLNYTENGTFIYNPEIYARLPSIFFFCAGLILIYNIANKCLKTSTTLVLVLSIVYWAESLRHIAEVRSYAFMLFTIALGINALLLYEQKNRLLSLITLCIAITLGTLSHPIVGVYLGMSWLTTLLLKIHERKIDVRLIIYPLLSFIPYLIWLTLNHSQISGTMSEGVRWERAPNIYELYQFTRPSYPLLLFLLAIIVTNKKLKPILTNENIYLWIGLSFLLATTSLWVVSQFSNPLFLERYVLPMRIGWVLITIGLITNYQPFSKKTNFVSIGFAIVLTGLIFQHGNPPRVTTGGFWSNNPWADAGYGDEKYFQKNLPIICESSTTYLPRMLYFGNSRDYRLILDDKYTPKAKDNLEPSPKNIDQKMSKALSQIDKRQKIMPSSKFLLENKRFYLFNESFIDTDKNMLPENSYKRTILNPSKTNKEQTLTIELIEKKV